MILVNGRVGAAVSARERGLAYGDGVFRTFRLRARRAVWWARHYAKLLADCEALGMAAPDIRELAADLAQIADTQADCAVKIIVTRGESARGYAPDRNALPTRIVMAAAMPGVPAHFGENGIRAYLCATRLAAQPRLAGIKHLNRLENVLAAGEWSAAEFGEGIMCGAQGDVICGTRSNIFVVTDNRIVTPDLTSCGVAGVTRQLIMELAASNGMSVHVRTVSLEETLRADEVFVCNSLIGVWQVAELSGRAWKRGPVCANVARWIRDAGDT